MSNTSQASARINSLLDENSFVEIGAMVTARATDFNMNPKETPSDGVVTGHGLIDGKPVYVYSQDSSVLGGSIGEMHAKKITRLYDLAMKVGAPVVAIIDSTGIRLNESTDALAALGSVYRSMSLASGVIPQITAVVGNCGGGLSVLSSLSDFVVMEEKKAKMFVNSPNALPGNYEEKLDTASAKFQAEEAGNADVCPDEASVYAKVRELVSILPSCNEGEEYDECTDDLNRVCTNIAGYGKDSGAMLSMIADNNNFVEVSASYAKSIATGFIRLDGLTVGCVANRGEIIGEEGTEKFDTALTPEACVKAADFVNFCDAFEIPVLTLTSVTGFAACVECEKKISRAAAKLTFAFANAKVPKVNVVYGDAFGSAYVVMNSKELGCDMTYAWDTAKIGTMDAELAAKIICDGKNADETKECADKYAALQNSIEAAARRGYVDTVIAADDTRKYVVSAFEMLFTKREDLPVKKHGAV